MLLDAQGFGGDLIGVLRADAKRGQAGHGEQGDGMADQARPSWMVAAGSPVSSRAARA